MSLDKNYALLLLAKTRLTYSQIYDLTGIPINRISMMAQDVRPKEIRDENVLSGIHPDMHDELLKLKEEMEKEIPESLHQHVSIPNPDLVLKSDLNHAISFKYSVSTNKPVSKTLLLEELESIEKYLKGISSSYVHLYITIEGA